MLKFWYISYISMLRPWLLYARHPHAQLLCLLLHLQCLVESQQRPQVILVHLEIFLIHSFRFWVINCSVSLLKQQGPQHHPRSHKIHCMTKFLLGSCCTTNSYYYKWTGYWKDFLNKYNIIYILYNIYNIICISLEVLYFTIKF